MKLESLDSPPETPILSYEAERAAYEKQREETLEWSFRWLRAGELFFENQLVASLKPVGLIGLRKYRGSFQGTHIILRSELWGISILALESKLIIGKLRIEPRKTVFVNSNGVECPLRSDSIDGLDAWCFFAPDGWRMTITKADFNKPKYTFRVLDMNEGDPNRWLLATISLYNILR